MSETPKRRIDDDSSVSLGEIWRVLQEIRADVRRAIDDHEIRLRRLERWMYALPATLAIAVASAIVALTRH